MKKMFFMVVCLLMVLSSCTKTKYTDLDAEEERVLRVEANNSIVSLQDSLKAKDAIILELRNSLIKKGDGLANSDKTVDELRSDIDKLKGENKIKSDSIRLVLLNLNNTNNELNLFVAEKNIYDEIYSIVNKITVDNIGKSTMHKINGARAVKFSQAQKICAGKKRYRDGTVHYGYNYQLTVEYINEGNWLGTNHYWISLDQLRSLTND